MMNWEYLKQQYERFKEWQRHPIKYHLSDAEHVCQNCGCTFTGNFCPCCSQKAGIGRINWGSVHQGVMDIWGLGTRSLIYSLWQLLLRPGHIINDYTSGKRQMSFPPVKMLFILTLLYSFVVYWLLPMFIDFNVDSQELRAMNDFAEWQQSHYSWVMLIMAVMAIIPTWLLFRYSPRNTRHSLPEGFFIQVFLSIIMVLCAFLVIPLFLVDYNVTGLVSFVVTMIYYIIVYKYLFGYGLWGTFWRQSVVIVVILLWGSALIYGLFDIKVEWLVNKKLTPEQNVENRSMLVVGSLIYSFIILAVGLIINYFSTRKARRKANIEANANPDLGGE